MTFVPVQVLPEQPASSASEMRGADLELVVAHGHRLRIGPGFDGATLRRVLAVLAEGRSC